MIVLVTDSTAYISAAEAAALGVMVLPMTYSVDAQAPVNERYVDDNGDFERLIRENPTTLRTSQVSFVRFQSAFEELRAAGHQILCMTISSRLSGTYGNAFNAARELPGDGIRVVDSLSTAGGLTLLLREARRMIASGMNLADTAEAINAMRHRVQITFSVDDMEPLRRSGRLGSVKLSVSTILNIRPMLRCENGSIQSYAVVRGQNEQLRALIKAVPPEATNVIIQHFAAEERAEKLAAYFRERGRKAEIRHIGPVLGIHLGAGSIALAWIDPE